MQVEIDGEMKPFENKRKHMHLLLRLSAEPGMRLFPRDSIQGGNS